VVIYSVDRHRLITPNKRAQQQLTAWHLSLSVVLSGLLHDYLHALAHSSSRVILHSNTEQGVRGNEGGRDSQTVADTSWFAGEPYGALRFLRRNGTPFFDYECGQGGSLAMTEEERAVILLRQPICLAVAIPQVERDILHGLALEGGLLCRIRPHPSY
jgi:hypothetical protein